MATVSVTSECELARIRLDEARAGLHALLTGSRVVQLGHADKSIGYYAAGNIGELNDYIRQLQGQVDACNGVPRGRRVNYLMPTGW
jgi:hypothetical protein